MQQEKRATAWEAAKAILDAAATEGRDLTAEEQQSYDRINAELDERSALIERFRKDMEREERAAQVQVPEAPAPERRDARPSDVDILRQMAAGEVRNHRFEARDLTTTTSTDGPELVPQGFWNELQRKLTYVGPMMDPSIVTVINTESGNDIKVPTEASRSTAAAVTEADAVSESDPQFSTLTLRAHKFGALVQVSSELLNESGVDLIGYLADQFAMAIGTAVNSKLTVGTGTTEPAGIVAGAGAGITGDAAVAGVFDADDLIDLAHSVNSAYARRPKAGWMMNRATLGDVRKLQDGAGNYIFTPVVGGQDQLLGYPIIENPDVVDVAATAKSVIFGDLGAYMTRIVGAGVDVARSDDYAFANDLVTFRATIRLDGALGGGGSDAVKYFVGGAAA